MTQASQRVFISYRRSDSGVRAGRLADALEFKTNAVVFYDVDSMTPGEPFPDRLRSDIAGADTVVVILGPSWLSAASSHGTRRIDDPADWVATEIRTALDLEKPLLVGLVDGATMPSADQLPKALRGLASVPHVDLRDGGSWAPDVDALISGLPQVERLDRGDGTITPGFGRIPTLSKRIFASLLDLGPYFLLFLGAAALDNNPDEGTGAVVWAAILGVIGLWLVLTVLLMGRQGPRNGQTYGKQVTGLRVIREDGARLDRSTIVSRSLAKFALVLSTLLILGLPMLLAVIAAKRDTLGRMWHDLAAGTVVVRV